MFLYIVYGWNQEEYDDSTEVHTHVIARDDSEAQIKGLAKLKTENRYMEDKLILDKRYACPYKKIDRVDGYEIILKEIGR
jgi:hypothetical protein